MDALLWELLSEGSPDDIVQVLIKSSDLDKTAFPGLRVVAQIGDIASCRIRRGDIEAVRNQDAVFSMKAQRVLYLDPPLDEHYHTVPNDSEKKWKMRSRPPLPFRGKGVAIGIADWGFDFTHPNFLHRDGTTRFLWIWDQGAEYDDSNIYGYGAMHSADDINAALQSDRPFFALDYHPGKADLYHNGMHGTHVLDIAAGNGTIGEKGTAPDADLIAVHLSTSESDDLANLGTSVTVFDALHFMHAKAGNRPLVINMSVGSHGDAHTGLSLIEQAIDRLMALPNRAVVQSCGNYFASRVHTAGALSTGEEVAIEWLISKEDKTPNEIEIWYSAGDEVEVGLLSPDAQSFLQNGSTGRQKIESQSGQEIGRYYHRKEEPNTGLSQIVIILGEAAKAGKWTVVLRGAKVTDGKFHAWIERDRGAIVNQSRFPLHQSSTATTTGSICNGFHTISVGAFDDNDERGKVAFFSSVGPTWDGRQKPFCVAPGVGILAAKSASPFQDRNLGELTHKTGTSMAAPCVTGAVALLYESARGPLSIQEIKDRLIAACRKPDRADESEKDRLGYGLLSVNELFTGQLLQNQNVFSAEPKSFEMKKVEQPMALESMLKACEEMYPDLKNGELKPFFESMPSSNLLEDQDIETGDLLVRLYYGHHDKGWYGVVEFVHGNEAWAFTNSGRKKIAIDKSLGWELKKLRPDYRQQNTAYNVNSGYYGDYNSSFEEDVKVRGDLSTKVVLRWFPVRADKGRVYYVTSGGNGASNSPATFEIVVDNNNPHYIRKTGWAYALRLMGKGQPNEVVELTGQKGNYFWENDKDVIKAYPAAQNKLIAIRLQDINKAYRLVNLNDPRMQLEVQLFWSEKEARTGLVKFFYNRIRCDFYVVNPIEFIETNEISFSSFDFDTKGNVVSVNIIKDGKVKRVKYPPEFNKLSKALATYQNTDATFEITTTDAEIDIDENQVSVSLSDTRSDADQLKLSAKLAPKVSFGVDAKLLKAGVEIAQEFGIEFQTTKTITSEYVRSYLNSKTVQKSFAIQRKHQFVIRKSLHATQLMMKPIFKPVSVRIVRFESIDAHGVAALRNEDPKSSIIWVNETYHFYQQSEPIARRRGEEFEDDFTEDDVKLATEVDLLEQKLPSVKTKYGAWAITVTLKLASSVSGDSGLPVGGQVAITSKAKDGQRVTGGKQEIKYDGFADLLGDIKIKDLSLDVGGEWSGDEISAYGKASFKFSTKIGLVSAACKLIIFKINEGESPSFGAVHGEFNSPSFELEVGGVATKVYLRYKVSWAVDKKKVAVEVLKKIGEDKLKKEAVKQGVKLLSREAGKAALKKLGPIITAFGIGWDVGTFLNDHTVAGEIAVEVQEKILGDLNVQYQNADTLGKMFLISKNAPQIVGAAIVSGVAGVVAGIGDLALFKIFNLDKLPDFGRAVKSFLEFMDSIPKIGDAWGDMILSTAIKLGIKFNPKYSIVRDPNLRIVVSAVYNHIKAMYKPNGLSEIINVHLYDVDVDVDYNKIVELIIARGLSYGNIISPRIVKEGGVSALLDLHIQDFLMFLETNKLIEYKIFIDDDLSTDSLDQHLINELFLNTVTR